MKNTDEGGFAIQFINRTGQPSKKGTIVSASNQYDYAVMFQANEYDAIGVVYESGIPDGQPVWVVISGIAEVLLKQGTASKCGNWCKSADDDGRALCSLTQPSGSGFNNAEDHFKEIGHCLETKLAGNDVLCKILIHFN